METKATEVKLSSQTLGLSTAQTVAPKAAEEPQLEESTEAAVVAVSDSLRSEEEDLEAVEEQNADSGSEDQQRAEQERQAKRLEEKLNRTSVQFEVKLGADENDLLRFKVVDQESGEIIKEFPPGELDATIQQVDAGGSLSLVDESA